MTQVSLEEKRLKQLKQQLFGKEQPLAREVTSTKTQVTNNFQFEKEAQKPEQTYQTTLINPASLKGDLIKIAVFSSIALTIQISLFLAYKQGLINLFR